ncbi:MAG: hypothetical protein ACYDCQ_14695 [Dehalococcoidia bacterium]
MTSEAAAIDISSMPEVARLVREVAETGVRRVLTENGAPVAEIAPARRRRRRQGHRRPLTMDDPLWKIVGMITEDIGSDLSANKHRYLAEAYASESE